MTFFTFNSKTRSISITETHIHQIATFRLSVLFHNRPEKQAKISQTRETFGLLCLENYTRWVFGQLSVSSKLICVLMLCILVVTLNSSLHSLIQSSIQLLLGSYNQWSDCCPRLGDRTVFPCTTRSCHQCDWCPSVNLTTVPTIGDSIAIIRSVIVHSILMPSLLYNRW
jgi:hypothetical protein